MRLLQLGESEELLKEAFGLNTEINKTKVKTNKIELIRVNLEENIRNIINDKPAKNIKLAV